MLRGVFCHRLVKLSTVRTLTPPRSRRQVGDAERPVREEAGRLLQEVQALRVSNQGAVLCCAVLVLVLVLLMAQGGLQCLASPPYALGISSFTPSARFSALCINPLCLPLSWCHTWQADKEGLQGRLRELEQSIGRIKESCYSETAQKRWAGTCGAVGGGHLCLEICVLPLPGAKPCDGWVALWRQWHCNVAGVRW